MNPALAFGLSAGITVGSVVVSYLLGLRRGRRERETEVLARLRAERSSANGRGFARLVGDHPTVRRAHILPTSSDRSQSERDDYLG